MNTKFNRERIRFDVKQPDTLVIQGWFEDDTEGAEQFEAELDEMAAAALADRCTATNPRPVTVEDIKEIYRKAFIGKLP